MRYAATGFDFKIDLSYFDLRDEMFHKPHLYNQGIPTKESLNALGLDYVSDDLERRGILDDEQS